jgi:hypothetical protein
VRGEEGGAIHVGVPLAKAMAAVALVHQLPRAVAGPGSIMASGGRSRRDLFSNTSAAAGFCLRSVTYCSIIRALFLKPAHANRLNFRAKSLVVNWHWYCRHCLVCLNLGDRFTHTRARYILSNTLNSDITGSVTYCCQHAGVAKNPMGAMRQK